MTPSLTTRKTITLTSTTTKAMAKTATTITLTIKKKLTRSARLKLVHAVTTANQTTKASTPTTNTGKC